MNEFNRFDIAEGYWLYHTLWHMSGSTRRCLIHRPLMPQLRRLGFKPKPNLSLDTAEEGALRVYESLVKQYERRI